MTAHHCPLVLVEWEDSAQPTPAWSFLQTYKPDPIVHCVSVGWLIHDGDDLKAIAPNFGNVESDSSAQVSGVIRIPTRCITRTVYLDEPGITSPSSHPG